MKTRIVECGARLFRSKGIKETTMDDIAKELSISKRTLYKHFGNRSDLVKACVDYRIDHHKIFENKGSVVDDLIHCYNVSVQINELNTNQRMNVFMRQHNAVFLQVQSSVMQFASNSRLMILDGQSQGYIRDNISDMFVYEFIHNYLIGLFFCKRCEQSNSMNYSLDLFLAVVRGILTPQGEEYFNNKIK